METTERIVESYVRYIKGWATISNIRGPRQVEIDLLAIDPVDLQRYHIESSVITASNFSALNDKPYDPAGRTRVQRAYARRTLGFFEQEKFGSAAVRETLARYGFRDGNYRKVIVSWGWTPAAGAASQAHNIELWDFRDLIPEITATLRGRRDYFSDDVLRTLHLYVLAERGNPGFGGAGQPDR